MAARIVKFSYTKNPEVNLFFKESKSTKKKNLAVGREGMRGVARVSDFFLLQKNQSLKKKKTLVFFLRG